MAQAHASQSRESPTDDPVCEPDDAVVAARAAGLRYVSDAEPGIRRRRAGRGFAYTDIDGSPVRDRQRLQRIKALVIPPAWTDVWICTSSRGHIQAVGRDERGRKQYLYHVRWRQERDSTKYHRLVAFGDALPELRRQLRHDLALPGLPREKLLAALVSLLEETRIRVGNEAYARQNGSYGLTTLRNRHVDVDGSHLRFRFRGKSGKSHLVELNDPRLAKIVRRCQELPGQDLFEYVADDGEPRTIGSTDVNDYIRAITSEEFTAKEFRTWAGTVLAATSLDELGEFESETQAKKNVAEAIKSVAKQLGNTAAVCRKCYIHPGVIDGYENGTLLAALRRPARAAGSGSEGMLRPEEARVLAFLHRLERAH